MLELSLRLGPGHQLVLQLARVGQLVDVRQLGVVADA